MELKSDFWKSITPGYRFRPSDQELVVFYLMKKLKNQPLPPSRIVEINLYKHHPQELADAYRREWGEEDEYYFFTQRDKKYMNGTRPNRSARNGYWKATGSDKKVTHEGNVIGLKKTLVFYIGKHPQGVKTNWIMHEYRVADDNKPNSQNKTSANHNMKLDDWVLCRIRYKKPGKTPPKDSEHESGVPQAQNEMGESEPESESEPEPSAVASATSTTGHAGNTHDAAYFNQNQPYGATSATGNQVGTVDCNGHAQKSQTLTQDSNNVGPHTNVQAMIRYSNVTHHTRVAALLDHHSHLVQQQPRQQQQFELNHVVGPTNPNMRRLPPQQFYPSSGAVTDYDGEPWGGAAGAANCATCNGGNTHGAACFNLPYGATSATGNQVRTEWRNGQLVPNKVNVGPQTSVDALLENDSSVQQQFNTTPMSRLPPQQFYYPSGSVTDNGQIKTTYPNGSKTPGLLPNPYNNVGPHPTVVAPSQFGYTGNCVPQASRNSEDLYHIWASALNSYKP